MEKISRFFWTLLRPFYNVRSVKSRFARHARAVLLVKSAIQMYYTIVARPAAFKLCQLHRGDHRADMKSSHPRLLDSFRRIASAVVDTLIRCLWCEDGIYNPAAVSRARARCISRAKNLVSRVSFICIWTKTHRREKKESDNERTNTMGSFSYMIMTLERGSREEADKMFKFKEGYISGTHDWNKSHRRYRKYVTGISICIFVYI